MSKSSKNHNLYYDERGFASIVIALLLIIVLALLTVGFAQLARREQQNALDRQLAIQANYAAESGINDAIQDLKSGAINKANADAIKCMKQNTGFASNPIINQNNSVLYSCLLVNLEPKNLHFGDISVDSTKYATFTTDTPLTRLAIDWDSADGRTNFPSNTSQFLPVNQWATNGYLPVLQVTITKLSTLTRSGLIGNSLTAYLYPSSALTNNVLVFGSSNNAQVISGNCANIPKKPYGKGTYSCDMKIDGLKSTGPFLIVITNYYDNANVNITGNTGASHFNGAQAIIDVTGQAKNVLKRLQVFYPLGNKFNLPQAALEGQNICKRQQAAPIVLDPNTHVAVNNGTTFLGTNGQPASAVNDPQCILQ